MVKMAHATLPKLICTSLNTPSMCPTDFAATTALADVLKSEPVKRLFNQPNIVIKTIPLKLTETSASNNNVIMKNKIDNLSIVKNDLRQPETSLVPIKMDTEDNEDENLLPSKKDGKSEIALVPIKRERKSCGHYEPCENIVCDVAIQQYVDFDSSLPMLATSIEDDEINAPVSKHCKNDKCDALSIDHDRCRRAVVRLNRCNRSSACDICGIMLHSPRTRIYHKNCMRKNEYRHNEVDGAQILKERMREREIQIMEAFKMKKNDYLDSFAGNNLAMEMLRNNEELIIIPKSVPTHQPTINITSITTSQTTQTPQCASSSQQSTTVNNVFRNILPNIPIVLPQQSIVIGKTSCSNKNNTTASVQVAFPDTLNRSVITPTNAVPLSQNQYLTFATQHNTHQITINDLLFTPQSQFMTTPIQPKPLLTPIRVVPITNLITQPSLLHQTQGIPKFCIMADNTLSTPLTVTTPPVQPVQQPVLVPKISIPQNRVAVNNVKSSPPRKRRTPTKKKRKLKKKDFKCNYCLKRFSTDWYFKIHLAKHTGEKPVSCKICSQSFTNRYEMKKHMAETHQQETHQQETHQQETEQSYKCSNCTTICKSSDGLKHHRQKCHGITECTLCDTEILVEELDRHMESMHKDSENMDTKENNEESDSSDDTSKLVSHCIKTKTNNHDLQQEDNTNKMNGCISIPNQLAVGDIK